MKVVGFFQPIGYEIVSQLIKKGIDTKSYDFHDVSELSELEEEMILSIGRNALFTYEPLATMKKNQIIQEHNKKDDTIIIVTYENEMLRKKLKHFFHDEKMPTVVVASTQNTEEIEKLFPKCPKIIVENYIGKWMRTRITKELLQPILVKDIATYVVEYIINEEKREDVYINGQNWKRASQDDVKEIEEFNKQFSFLQD